ncbi:MAG: MotA/TolQ/ExbB proton channel family protein [Xanthomonadaceae bacterium]|nr:MotA/TolQ/ExbB proton channel family protein [Xanthomonadaceae bacterium]
MYQVYETLTLIRDFMELGGNVLWGVFFVTALMWTFLLERFWYYKKIYPTQRQAVIDAWRERGDTDSWYAKRVREKMISEVRIGLSQYLSLIKTCIGVLPLIGLLGTVTGMIQVFEVMAYTGSGNARLMAGGVSAATIPTMAGMVAALSGLAIAARLDHYARDESARVEDSLRRA